MLLKNYIFLVGFIICVSSSGPRHSLVLVGETLSYCCCHSPSFNVNQWGSRLAGAIRPIIGVSDKCSFIIATTVKYQSIILLDRVGWLELLAGAGWSSGGCGGGRTGSRTLVQSCTALLAALVSHLSWHIRMWQFCRVEILVSTRSDRLHITPRDETMEEKEYYRRQDPSFT